MQGDRWVRVGPRAQPPIGIGKSPTRTSSAPQQPVPSDAWTAAQQQGVLDRDWATAHGAIPPCLNSAHQLRDLAPDEPPKSPTGSLLQHCGELIVARVVAARTLKPPMNRERLQTLDAAQSQLAICRICDHPRQPGVPQHRSFADAPPPWPPSCAVRQDAGEVSSELP